MKHKLNRSQSRILADSLASFRATVAAMESALSAEILLGSGFAVVMREPHFKPDGSRDFDTVRALARVNPKTRVYEANAPHCWPSLDLLPDHLCGLCLYSPESAAKVIAQVSADRSLPANATYSAMHLRDIQTDRLVRARQMVIELEKLAA